MLAFSFPPLDRMASDSEDDFGILRSDFFRFSVDRYAGAGGEDSTRTGTYERYGIWQSRTGVRIRGLYSRMMVSMCRERTAVPGCGVLESRAGGTNRGNPVVVEQCSLQWCLQELTNACAARAESDAAQSRERDRSARSRCRSGGTALVRRAGGLVYVYVAVDSERASMVWREVRGCVLGAVSTRSHNRPAVPH